MVGAFVKSISQLTVRGLDFKRVHFLTKCFPAKKEDILKKTGMSRQRSLKLAPPSEEIAKSSGKIFEFAEQECLGQIAAHAPRRSLRQSRHKGAVLSILSA
jgi:hypothetical protein